MAKGQRPVYWLKITDKNNTKHRTHAGAAWVSEYDQLRIVLNPGVRLNWDDQLWITLEPIDQDNPPRLPCTKRADPSSPESSEEQDGKPPNGDIPF